MAELSRFWTTNDVGDGPAAGYEQDLFADFMVGVFTDGILRAVAGELDVTGTLSPITIALGAAIVGGRYYQNTTLLQLAVATPSVGTTAFSVLLAADWTAQEVRAYVKSADDGNQTYPGVTDNWGTKVEIKISQGLIDVAGNITLTPGLSGGRTWATYSSYMPEGSVTTPKIDDGAVTTDKIFALAITNPKIKDSAVSTTKIEDEAVTTAKINDGAITNQKIAPGGLIVQTVDIEDAAIQLHTLGIGTLRFRGRKGYDPDDWSDDGDTFFSAAITETQCGSAPFDFAGALTTTVDIYFPSAYLHGPPMGLVTMRLDQIFAFFVSVGITEVYNNYMRVTLARDSKTASIAGAIYWYVMGGPIA